MMHRVGLIIALGCLLATPGFAAEHIVSDEVADASQLSQVQRRPGREAPTREVPPPPAVQPPPEHHHHAPAEMSPGARPATYDPKRFGPDPSYPEGPYDSKAQIEIYGGKSRVLGPRPPIEFGYPLYSEGPLPDSFSLLGDKNLLRPQLLVYGDFRTAVAYNDNGALETGQIAARLNLDVDLKLTATERIHGFFRPLDRRNRFSRAEFFGPDRQAGFEPELNGNVQALFFEGDFGAIASGITDSYASFDLPFAVGLTPLLFQNGVWMEDAILGGAITIPARNSRVLDISNFDITFFAGTDKVSTAAIRGNDNQIADHSADLFGIATFVDVLEGYLEAGYGYTRDRRPGGAFNFDYHNATIAFTRRYGGWLSNSVRVVWNGGQEPALGKPQTADGTILLIENSLITHLPSTLIPYANFWVGFDRPQSLARDLAAGGILKNTGINFETDGLTGFPKLDDTGNDTFGGALGIEYLFDLDQQIVVEAATVQIMGDPVERGRPARGNQYALGVRYQKPLSDRWIVRADAIMGWREHDRDISGVRLELRRKF
jgi:hypothetical protein